MAARIPPRTPLTQLPRRALRPPPPLQAILPVQSPPPALPPHARLAHARRLGYPALHVCLHCRVARDSLRSRLRNGSRGTRPFHRRGSRNVPASHHHHLPDPIIPILILTLIYYILPASRAINFRNSRSRPSRSYPRAPSPRSSRQGHRTC